MRQDLNDILIFTRVIDHGSFTRAAKALRMPKSSVSRAVSRLEEALQTRLMQRSTRQLNLTEVGQRYYDHCKRIIDELDASSAIIDGAREKPTGTLRVTAPLIIGQAFFGAIIGEYISTYKDVDVYFLPLNRRVNLIEEGFDLAFVPGNLPDSSLIAKRMGLAFAALYASPDYLKKNGTPKTPQDLIPHQKITNAVPKDPDIWRLKDKEGTTDEIKVDTRYETIDVKSMADIAIAGGGITELPTFVATPHVEAGTLKRVLPNHHIREVPIHAVYPTYRGLSPSVRAFIDIADRYLQKVLAR